MDFGKLRHLITIESPTWTVSAASGAKAVSAWSTLAADVWANVRPITARESVQYAQTKMSVSHEITTRYVEGVTHDCQLVFRGRRLSIVGIRNVEEQDRELSITASELK